MLEIPRLEVPWSDEDCELVGTATLDEDPCCCVLIGIATLDEEGGGGGGGKISELESCTLLDIPRLEDVREKLLGGGLSVLLNVATTDEGAEDAGLASIVVEALNSSVLVSGVQPKLKLKPGLEGLGVAAELADPGSVPV